MFFMFTINDQGQVSSTSANAAFSAALSSASIHSTLYTRAAMSNPLIDNCDASGVGSAATFANGDSYAYKTVMIPSGSGNACGTLIPDDAVYSYVRVNGANGAAIVFYDTVNGDLIYNYAGAEIGFGQASCSDDSQTFQTYYPLNWVDSNSWRTINLGTGIASLKLFGSCYDLSSDLPQYAATQTFQNPGNANNEINIVFTQPTPFHHTSIELTEKGHTGEIGKFHVHQHNINHLEACTDTGGHYNPLNVDLVNNYGNGVQDSFEIGDLNGKHGKWDTFGFQNDGNTHAKQVEDAYLPLWGMDSIAGRSIVFHAQDGARFGCVNIGLTTSAFGEIPEEVQGHVDFAGVLEGQMSFRQKADDPNSPTIVKSTLKFSDSRTETTQHKYHVHTIYDFSGSNAECNNNGGHYHPSTGVPCLTPNLNGNTVCEIGDLNNKLGLLSLTGSDTKLTQTDNWLPLSGDYSILGKSITIHNTDGSRMSCGGVKTSANKLKAWVDYDNNLNGWFSLSVSNYGSLDNEMKNFGDANAVIEYFPYQSVISPRFGIDKSLSGSECSSLTSGVSDTTGLSFSDLAWSPIRVTGSNGEVTCSVLIPNNANLNFIRHIGSAGSGMIFYDTNNGIGLYNYMNGGLSYFYTDTACTNQQPQYFNFGQNDGNRFYRVNFPEARAVSINGECIAFKTEMLPQYSVVDQLSVGSATLDISFKQPTPFHHVEMTVTRNQDFVDNNPIGKLHIHQFNVETEMDCSAQGGLYQDLSARHGYMNTWNSDLVNVFYDGSFTTWGVDAINGRTVNLHDAGDASGVACGEVGLQCGGLVKPPVNTAFVPFTGAVNGYIKLVQNAMDEFAPTMIRASLKVDQAVYGSTLTGTDHKFHIHTENYQSDSGAGCINTGGHYHPQDGVPCESPNLNGNTVCEIGDLSNKHGLLSFEFTESNFQFQDMTLPLNGTYSVMDRSIVIHEPVTGARQACGPTDAQEDMTARLEVTGNDKDDMARNVLAAVLNHRGITELPPVNSGRKRRAINDILQAIDDHGCWCPKFSGDQALFGLPVDDLDKICRGHSRCVHCEKYVTCEGVFDTSYEILINDQDGFECVDMNECTKNRCMCDVEYAVAVANYLAAGSPVDPNQANLDSASCVRNLGGATGTYNVDSCCGSSPNWVPFDSSSSTCVAGNLQ